MTDDSLKCIGIGWYKPEQWNVLLEISEDREELESTWIEWFNFASKQENELLENGINVVRVDVDIEELIDYCKVHKCSVNGKSRSEFITYIQKQQASNKSVTRP